MRLSRKLIIIGVIYFAEGFPFGLIWDTLPIYFRLHGVSLKDIGLMSLISLPWTFKFIWAPAVDRYFQYRHWMAAVQFFMAALLLLLVVHSPTGITSGLWLLLAALAVLSATQDIAIDAYSIQLLEPKEMGMANGFRVSAYRVALLIAGGIFVALGGWMGWGTAFGLAAALLAGCGVFSLCLPSVLGDKKEKERSVLEPLLDLLRRPGVVWVALFILLYKLGDMAMGPMVRPFWVDRGLSTTEIGFITGSGGIIAAISGALLGGAFTTRFGIFNGLWFLGIWQAVSNLGYWAAASMPQTGHYGVYAASLIESFCGGLGTAAFLAFLMSLCRKELAATQYALLSALFGLARSLSGAVSGYAAARYGYAAYFGLTILLAAPAYLFIFKARAWLPPNSKE